MLDGFAELDVVTGGGLGRRGDEGGVERATESLGGRYHQLADEDVPTALLSFARTENATRLMIGAGRHNRLLSLPLWPGTAQRVIRGGSGTALHIVPRAPGPNGVSPATGESAREEPANEGDNGAAAHLLASPGATSNAIGR